MELSDKARTQSTLLIPERLVSDFWEKTEEIGREDYFHFLIKSYRPLILAGTFGKRESVKRRFQEQGDNLIRKNFRPVNSDWTEFNMLADYLGLSMTALFRMLLTLDIAEFAAIIGEVPPTIVGITTRTHLKYTIPECVFRKIRIKSKNKPLLLHSFL